MGKINNVSLVSEYVGRTDSNHRMARMDEWKCKLVYNGKQFTFPFFQGVGLNGEEPEKMNVLDCLFSDSSAFNHNPNWEYFAHEFGYDIDTTEDRKKVKLTYEACGRIAKNLGRLLGDDYRDIEKEVFQYMENN